MLQQNILALQTPRRGILVINEDDYQQLRISLPTLPFQHVAVLHAAEAEGYGDMGFVHLQFLAAEEAEISGVQVGGNRIAGAATPSGKRPP